MKTVKSNRYSNPDNAKKRLRYWLLVFFIGISLPVYFLLYKVYSQLENETWYKQRNQAELLVERIERQLLEKLQPEQQRPIAEYSFFNVLENPLLQSATVNLSPLSELPPKSDIPGLVGYFQIDPDGSLRIPALPELNTHQQSGLLSGLSAEALAVRIALKEKLYGLLMLNGSEKEPGDAGNDKAGTKDQKEDYDTAPEALLQTNRFDDYFLSGERDQAAVTGSIKATIRDEKKRATPASGKKNRTLSEEKLRQLHIETALWKQKRKQNEAFSNQQRKYPDNYRLRARKETVKIPDQKSAGELFKRSLAVRETVQRKMSEMETASEQTPLVSSQQRTATNEKDERITTQQQLPVRILSFESEVSPLQMITLGGRYLCFYRNAWNGKSRLIQGLIVDALFLRGIIQPILASTRNLPLSSLLIVDKGKLLQQFKQTDAEREFLLYRRTLLSPFQQMEIIVNSGSLSAASGKQVLDMVSMALARIISAGFILFYRLAAGQIELAKQQRNFISSVSHELKTPLTSIRMYSEILRSDWVADEKRKRGYYDYIFFESERLSRLIGNVLQLARLENHQQQKQLLRVNAKQLLQRVRTKVAAQIEAANYHLTPVTPEHGATDAEVTVEEDGFMQIMINLVDNAIKFSGQSENKSIDIGYKIRDRGKQVIFFVRDYGPGVEKQRMKKIFRLFYRATDELTRTQPGVGIGLALVMQLAESMGAGVDLVNRHPGAEFQVIFNV